MNLPFGDLQDSRLTVSFSSADYSVAVVLTAIKERCDMFGEMKVVFLGVSTEIPAGPSPIFRPVAVKAYFEYIGSGDPKPILEKVYILLWEAVALTFPTEPVWASAKGDFSKFISAQADLIRARVESNKGE